LFFIDDVLSPQYLAAPLTGYTEKQVPQFKITIIHISGT